MIEQAEREYTQASMATGGFPTDNEDLLLGLAERLIAEVRRLQAIEAAANDAATAIRRVLNLTVKVPAGELDPLDDCYVFTEWQYRMLDKAYAAIIATKKGARDG